MPYIGLKHKFSEEMIAALPKSSISKEDFIVWALRLSVHDRTCSRDTDTGCPLALFLQASGYRDVVVDYPGYGFTLGDGMVFFRHNEFTRDLVITVDAATHRPPEDRLLLRSKGQPAYHMSPVSRLELLTILGVYENPETVRLLG